MSKKARGRERRTSRAAGPPVARDDRRRALSLALLRPPSGVVKQYTTFLMDGKRMPLYWCDPEACKRDFDAFFEGLQASRGDADLLMTVERHPEVVECMRLLMPAAEWNDTAESVREAWQRARTTMLYVCREYCLTLVRSATTA